MNRYLLCFAKYTLVSRPIHYVDLVLILNRSSIYNKEMK